MFNLIVGYTDGTIDASRVVEYTSDLVKGYIQPTGMVDPSRLVGLPTLVMPETGGLSATQFARLGHIQAVNLVGRNYRYVFVPTPGVQQIPSEYVVEAAGELGIVDWEFTRSHWAVKERDLYGALFSRLMPPIVPKVFTLPDVPQESDLVTVMMPFDTAFDPVYEALQIAADAAGMRCQRADDIWIHDHVMDDIIDLIWRARVVISDLSGRNTNVFYETGIAHAWGRDVIQITRNADDVPFDLRALRYIGYLPNREGMDKLKTEVWKRLQTLTA